MKRIKIALIENCGFDFYNYRVPLAHYLRDSGFEVFAVVPKDSFTSKIAASGITTLTYSFARNSLDFLSLISSVRQLKKYNKKYNFDIVHSFRLQPNVIGNLSFCLSKRIVLINHVTGLGFAFTSKSFMAIFYRFVILTLYQIILLFSSRVICQNNDDKKVLSNLLWISKKIMVIEGSGIDLKSFSRNNVNQEIVNKLLVEISIKNTNIVITFIGKLLINKGIREFIKAAKAITGVDNRIRFLIIGWIDSGNPSFISKAELSDLKEFPNIFLLGRREEIKEFLFITDIFVLPTYREGFSRSILEAMAFSLPVVTTNVPGAKDEIRDNYNGILVESGDSKTLIEALQRLINEPVLRKEMGKRGNEMVENFFSAEVIFHEILNMYREIFIQR